MSNRQICEHGKTGLTEGLIATQYPWPDTTPAVRRPTSTEIQANRL